MNTLSDSAMSKSSGHISAQDLLALPVMKNSKSAFLRLKSYSSFMHSVKWKQRFVILATNEIYVYENELSKKALHCIPLLGYNKIQRYQSEKYRWSFSIVGAVRSVKQHVFSCSTDLERREWMRKIKDHLYKANDVPRSFTDELNQLASGTEEEYIDLEEPVFTRDNADDDKGIDGTDVEKKVGDYSDDDFCDDGDDSDVEELAQLRRSGRKFSTGSINADRLLPPLPGEMKPPRYSALEDVAGHSDSENDDTDDRKSRISLTYQNMPQAPIEPTMSKLELCQIKDPDLERNRDKCNEMLQSKCHLGTYLIRKSRQGESLVLAVLTDNSLVKEYRLEIKGNLYRLVAKNDDADFISIDAILQYYTGTGMLPGLKHFLTYGIFECEEEIYSEMNM